MSVTATAVILAYAASTKAIPLVYLAPMVMNTFAMIMILDKAVSIQRKVGYLQMLEQHYDEYEWMWETQLDAFRGKVPLRAPVAGDPARKHSYVTSVGWMLFGLNLLSGVICLWGVWATERPLWGSRHEAWAILIAAGVLLALGLGILVVKRGELVHGRHSGPAIRDTWRAVLDVHKVKQPAAS